MQKVNFGKLLEQELEKIEKSGNTPSLLLHACCAPCSSSVLEYLVKFFDITLFYHNPNIYPKDEFTRRKEELERLITYIDTPNKLDLVVPEYDENEFFFVSKGLENEKEGGSRCEKCFILRLGRTYEYAEKNGFDYFATTLTVSPLKNAELINRIGETLAKGGGTKWLYSDFKKKGGYLRSCELSKQYGLYRQNFCGCVYSKAQADAEKRF